MEDIRFKQTQVMDDLIDIGRDRQSDFHNAVRQGIEKFFCLRTVFLIRKMCNLPKAAADMIDTECCCDLSIFDLFTSVDLCNNFSHNVLLYFSSAVTVYENIHHSVHNTHRCNGICRFLS